MKVFIRILSYGKPLYIFFISYGVLTFLHTLFSIFNFSLLIPLLDLLFGNKPLTPNPTLPTFNWNVKYVLALFDYYFQRTISEQGKWEALQFVCLILISSVILANIALYTSIMITEYLRAKIIRNIRQVMFQQITSLHLGYFSEKRKGDLMARFTTDSYELEFTIQNIFHLLLKSPVALVGYFVALFYISAQLTLFTLFLIPLSGIIINFIIKRLRNQAEKGQAKIGSINSLLEEALGGLKVIKGFGALGYIQQKFNQEIKQYARIVVRMGRWRELVSPISEVFGILVISLILLYGGSLVLAEKPTMQASEFITYLVLFSQVLRPAKDISNSISSLQRSIVSAKRMFAIIDTPSQIQDLPHAQPLTEFKHSIEFKDVWFRYEEKWILKSVSFTIPKGKTVALVGATGSGKSTIAYLIPRFYDIEQGQILIDGKDIKQYQINSIVEKIGVVWQETILFNDTIYNNIAFAKPQATPNEVEQAARIAHAHEFIMQTEKGYQTIVGDRGMKLSGGQQQRIAIARAILKNPSILILDEATSALDTVSEKLVQEALANLMQNRTTLVIAHRLSTIQSADEIIVLQNGEIVEKGTHSQLLAQQNGIYQQMYWHNFHS
ncbi:MAG: ABC transporter ATP-binding protein/permease [Microscillaceae bacterium]|nr:ABC transporter ATP-binding protein/permease [Microscillaceae bacterium]MDW8460876.1 ABC transporter ATP-binding protein [Cytophagales bacterium]